MKKNMGIIDKTIRIFAAIIMAVLYFTNVVTGTAGIVLFVLALVFLLTSTIRFCPLYYPFGINTCQVETNQQKSV